MDTLADELRFAAAENVRVTKDTLSVELVDGRTVSVPLVWFPRLLHADATERGNRRERVRNPLNGGWTVEASSAADDLEPAQQAPGKRLRQPTWKLQLCGERRIPGNHSRKGDDQHLATCATVNLQLRPGHKRGL